MCFYIFLENVKIRHPKYFFCSPYPKYGVLVITVTPPPFPLLPPPPSHSYSDSLTLRLTHTQTRSPPDSPTLRRTHTQTHSHADSLTMFLSYEQICGTSQLERSLLYSQGGAARGYITRPFASRLWGCLSELPRLAPATSLDSAKFLGRLS